MLHSIQIQLHHAVLPSLTSGWYVDELTYSSSDDSNTSEEETLTALRATPDAQVHLEEDKEEDFQMVPLDDEHWTTEEVSDRTLCIHKYALPH